MQPSLETVVQLRTGYEEVIDQHRAIRNCDVVGSSIRTTGLISVRLKNARQRLTGYKEEVDYRRDITDGRCIITAVVGITHFADTTALLGFTNLNTAIDLPGYIRTSGGNKSRLPGRIVSQIDRIDAKCP